jgi:histone H3/H4
MMDELEIDMPLLDELKEFKARNPLSYLEQLQEKINKTGNTLFNYAKKHNRPELLSRYDDAIAKSKTKEPMNEEQITELVTDFTNFYNQCKAKPMPAKAAPKATTKLPNLQEALQIISNDPNAGVGIVFKQYKNALNKLNLTDRDKTFYYKALFDVNNYQQDKLENTINRYNKLVVDNQKPKQVAPPMKKVNVLETKPLDDTQRLLNIKKAMKKTKRPLDNNDIQRYSKEIKALYEQVKQIGTRYGYDSYETSPLMSIETNDVDSFLQEHEVAINHILRRVKPKPTEPAAAKPAKAKPVVATERVSKKPKRKPKRKPDSPAPSVPAPPPAPKVAHAPKPPAAVKPKAPAKLDKQYRDDDSLFPKYIVKHFVRNAGYRRADVLAIKIIRSIVKRFMQKILKDALVITSSDPQVKTLTLGVVQYAAKRNGYVIYEAAAPNKNVVRANRG